MGRGHAESFFENVVEVRERREADLAADFESGQVGEAKSVLRVDQFQVKHIVIKRFARMLFEKAGKARVRKGRHARDLLRRQEIGSGLIQFVQQIFEPYRQRVGFGESLFEKRLHERRKYDFCVEHVSGDIRIVHRLQREHFIEKIL